MDFVRWNQGARRRRSAAGLALAVALLSLAAPAPAQQAGTIRGRVIAEGSARPLVGAQVSIPGTGRGTLTNATGDFLLPGVPAGAQTVHAQMLGYTLGQQTVTVAAGVVAQVEFVLAQEALALDAVVVTGQAGQARRREVGNAISQIDLATVVEPVQSVQNLLQARAPGVRVTFTDATIGGGAAIRLRGNTSATQSNQPLIYVDGVRQSNDAYPAGGNTKAASPLADINPNDIERVEVIKGAAAATLYGSEAAAGVIQIFTKRGAEGDPRFTYQTDQSLSKVMAWGSDERPYLNMDPWLQTAHGQTHVLSVSGGAPRVRYFLSGNLTDRDGVQVDEFEERYGLRSNVSITTGETVSFDVNAMFTNQYFETLPGGNGNNSLFFNVYRAPNNLVGGALPGDPEFENQINTLRVRDMGTTNQRAVLGLTGNWNPIENLNGRLTFGYDRMGQEQLEVLPYGHPITPQGQITETNWYTQSTTLDASLGYSLDLPSGIGATLSAGGQLVRREEHRLEVDGIGLPGPGAHTLTAAATQVVQDNETQRVNTGGFFGQAMFEHSDRYFLTVGARVDGSSAFGKDFGLEFYPKVSASYVISEEAFWNPAWGSLKLRAAYGFAGRAPGAFDAVRTWEPQSFLSRTAFVPDNVGNPALGPERTGEMEVGFDGSFFDDRLALDFTYYDKKTTDALFNVGQAPSLGFGGSQAMNVGSMASSGIELGADFTVLNTPTLTWNLGTDVSTNHSEVLDMGGVINYNLIEGHPAPVIRGAKIVNADEYADPIYELDAVLGPSEPTLIVGLNTTLQLPRGVIVTARGEYQGGHWAREFSSNLMAQRTGPGALGCDATYRKVPHDRSYLGPGDDHPNLDQLTAKERALCYSRSRADAWNLPRDFFKVREVSVQAPVPFAIPGAESANVTLSAQNFWRWVNKDFWSHDPESTGAANAATSLNGGNITDHIPAPATATLSVRVIF